MLLFKHKDLFLVLIICLFNYNVFSQSLNKYPGTPSSTYKSDYFGIKNRLNKSDNEIITNIQKKK